MPSGHPGIYTSLTDVTPLERAVTGFLRRFFFGSITMISPRFDVKEETLPACSPEDYAEPDAAKLKVFRRLNSYIGIIRASA